MYFYFILFNNLHRVFNIYFTSINLKSIRFFCILFSNFILMPQKSSFFKLNGITSKFTKIYYRGKEIIYIPVCRAYIYSLRM